MYKGSQVLYFDILSLCSNIAQFSSSNYRGNYRGNFIHGVNYDAAVLLVHFSHCIVLHTM